MTNTTNYSASNSDVRKRFSLRQIMTRAWQAYRNQGVVFFPMCESFGDALRWAWAEYRDILTKRVQASHARAEYLAACAIADAQKPAPIASRGPRSPLNPHHKPRFAQWGVRGNREFTVSVASR